MDLETIQMNHRKAAQNEFTSPIYIYIYSNAYYKHGRINLKSLMSGAEKRGSYIEGGQKRGVPI